jgi:hypothetical protein
MVVSESLVFYHIRNVSQTAQLRHDIRDSRMHKEHNKTDSIVAKRSCVRPISSRHAERTLLLLSKQRKKQLALNFDIRDGRFADIRRVAH